MCLELELFNKERIPMTTPESPRLSVSTWSLHRTLGLTFPDAPGDDGSRPRTETWGAGTLSLLEVPAQIAARGIHTLEICHFQLPSLEKSYLSELRAAIADAGVELLSLLVDAGDITDPDYHTRDLAWVGEKVEVAAALGAERTRVIAGKAETTPETMARSKAGMRELAARGRAQGVRVTTENWFPLLSRPKYVHELLDSLEGEVGLNFDFGNWGGPTKYDDLTAIAPRAESCHAKCYFDAHRVPDQADFTRCLDITRSAGFSGPYTLVYDGPDNDEWAGLKVESELVRPYLGDAGL
jgi:sugar phosphate isomerase/epimerase